MIFSISDVEHLGRLYNGFEIKMIGDVRDVVAKKYKAYVVDDHSVLIETPSVPHAFLHDGKVFDQIAYDLDKYNRACHMQHEVMRNGVMDSSKVRSKKFLMLKFPTSFRLSNDFFWDQKSKDKHAIGMHWIPYTNQFDVKDEQFEEAHAAISWVVTIDEDDDRVTTKRPPDEEGEELAKMMRGKYKKTNKQIYY